MTSPTPSGVSHGPRFVHGSKTEEQEVSQTKNVIAPFGLADDELKQIPGRPRIASD